MAAPVEQTPIPCRRCGAAMKETGPARLVGPVEVVCPYCGMRENLPEHQAQRVMALRARLAQLRAAKEAEEAPALAYARTIQMFKGSYGVMIGGMGLLILVTTGGGSISQFRALLGNDAFTLADKQEALLGSIIYPMFSLGIFFGVGIAYVHSLRRYKRAVEPRFRARAPLQEGQPARCRSCGGNLSTSQVSSAFVKCNYCAASNLITSELATDRLRVLQEETREQQQAASGVMARATEASASFQTDFYWGAGAGLALTAVVGVVAWAAVHALVH